MIEMEIINFKGEINMGEIIYDAGRAKDVNVADIQDRFLRGAEWIDIQGIALYSICKITKEEFFQYQDKTTGPFDIPKEMIDLCNKKLEKDGLYITGYGKPIKGQITVRIKCLM